MELNKTNETASDRGYSAYTDGEHFGFDPLQDLNLPSSYEEVLLRFQRLREKVDPPSLS